MARVSLLMIPVSVLAALVALKRLLTMSRALFVSHYGFNR